MAALNPDLMIALVCVLVGVLVGACSTWSGLGAGLALPALALLGMPMSATLLAVKLPVAASDLAAGFMPTREPCGAPLPTGRALVLALALLAGAVAALGLLRLPHELAVAGVMGLALWAWRAPVEQQPKMHAIVAWSGYIGGCGIGAGWLRRASAWQRCEDWRRGERAARQLAAAANVGAVIVLAAGGQGADERIALLALAQATGAWAVVAWRGGSPTGQAAPAARNA